ncbi:MAG: deoxyguanosinetriphosphate triphosphohydrolase, partial [Desulfobulbus sp.]|nr:deoxyguanosinetriphosphate triphosphohydrolase [Desulfobulbus sp.]
DLPGHLRKVIGDRSSERINAMVSDLVNTTLLANDGRLHLSRRMNDTINELRTFLYDNVYRNYRVHSEFEKAQRIIRDLYGFFLKHDFPNDRIDSCCLSIESPPSVDEEQVRHRQVCDFIAGMTDRYALALYSQIFIPRPWSVL